MIQSILCLYQGKQTLMFLFLYLSIMRHLCSQRPFHAQSTGSRKIDEVAQNVVCSVASDRLQTLCTVFTAFPIPLVLSVIGNHYFMWKK